MDEGDGDDGGAPGHANLLEEAWRGGGGSGHWPRLPGEGGVGAIAGSAEAHDGCMGLEWGGYVMGRTHAKK